MKRLHVHVAVADLARSTRFYATLFAAEPTVLKPDYAKWMLDDPRVNFAISARGATPGVEHLGIQVEDAAELADIHGRLGRADRPVLAEQAATCCYARSDKQWIADPQGVAWETFLTLGEATDYGMTGAVARLLHAEAAAADRGAPAPDASSYGVSATAQPADPACCAPPAA